MKILLIGPKWIGGWTEGVARGIQDLGYDLLVFYYDTPNAPTVANNQSRISFYLPRSLRKYFFPAAEQVGRVWEHLMNERLIKTSQTVHADVVMILKGETLEAETLQAFRQQGSQVVSWWVDDPISHFVAYPQVSKQFQYINAFFIFDRGRYDELKSIGVQNMTYLPCSFDPAVYHPRMIGSVELKRYQCDIGFVATYYPERDNLLSVMSGLNVGIWGPEWKNSLSLKAFAKGTFRGKNLTGAEAATMYNVARICPNMHHSQTMLGGLNMRAYEIPAAGGFQLIDDIPGLEEHFIIGKEIVVYSSPDHFREMVDYYLVHPLEREVIIERGRARVMRDHTYRQRLKVIFDTLM